MSEKISQTDLITLALARWRALHGDVTPGDYRAIVAAVREVKS